MTPELWEAMKHYFDMRLMANKDTDNEHHYLACASEADWDVRNKITELQQSKKELEHGH